MKIAVTGATGFVGRELVSQLLDDGHAIKAWCRNESAEPDQPAIHWVKGELGNFASAQQLVSECDAVVHSGLWRTTDSFRGHESNLVEYVQRNVVGSLSLIEAARTAGVRKFVFVSSGAVHERILDDRALDESHPLWPSTHYGACKAAIEKFVHSFGYGEGFDVCAVRPTAIYGLERRIEKSRWFKLAQNMLQGKPVSATGGGKLVHVQDVAAAIRLLLNCNTTAGECYSCCEGYFSDFRVAKELKEITGSQSEIDGDESTVKHQIDDSKLRSLGMRYGGASLLRHTLQSLVDRLRQHSNLHR